MRMKSKQGGAPLPEPIEPLVAPLSPSPHYDVTRLTCLSREARDALKLLARGRLKGRIVDRRFHVDYPQILRFLETVNTSGETAELTRLANLLRNYPLLLCHPYVWDILVHFANVASPFEELNHYAERWLDVLIASWAEGMTSGATVRISRSLWSPKKGRRLKLFPYINEFRGWHLSRRAKNECHDASQFREFYDKLMATLKPCARWKEDRHEYQDSRTEGRTILGSDIAERVAAVFEAFKKAQGVKAPPLNQSRITEAVRKALGLAKGRQPRHALACGLLATLPFVDARGRAVRLTAQLIDTTLESLRKEGIGPTRHRSERRAT